MELKAFLKKWGWLPPVRFDKDTCVFTCEGFIKGTFQYEHNSEYHLGSLLEHIDKECSSHIEEHKSFAIRKQKFAEEMYVMCPLDLDTNMVKNFTPGKVYKTDNWERKGKNLFFNITDDRGTNRLAKFLSCFLLDGLNWIICEPETTQP